MGKLRAVYPNVLALERPEVEGLAAPGASGAARDRRKLGDLELFEAFAREVGGAELGAEERALLTEVLTRLDRDERESGATEDSDAP